MTGTDVNDRYRCEPQVQVLDRFRFATASGEMEQF